MNSIKKPSPSMDEWMREAKKDASADKVGMYLVHNGVVRRTARSLVREGIEASPVKGMKFSCNEAKLAAAVEEARAMDGIYYVRTWLNSGTLDVGDDIMYVLIGGDTRPHTVDALQFLVGKIKNECVSEEEIK